MKNLSKSAKKAGSLYEVSPFAPHWKNVGNGQGIISALSLKLFSLFICMLVLLPAPADADVRLAGIFSDHMVLQRQKEIKIWGWADPDQNVTVELDGAMSNAKANAAGRWEASLPAKEAGGPFELHVRTREDADPDLVIKDILIGEVWLCSGQSNMEWTVDRSANAAEEIAAARFPTIRHFKVAHRPSNKPIKDVRSQWAVCSPETAAKFGAVAYYFGRELHQEMNVPVGLVHSSWGGTRIEPWTPPVGFANVPALENIYKKLQMGTLGTPEYRQAMSGYIAAADKWSAVAKEKFERGEPIEKPPVFPVDLIPVKNERQSPSHLYNGMIHGIVGFPIRGAIWYQGESNRLDGMMYFEKKKALIEGWREIWGQGEFPFYFVQIAPFTYGGNAPHVLPELWEAQSKALTIPKTGMAVINDVGNLKDIHPAKKQEVGHRLALLALKNDYGKTDLIASGPTFKSFEVKGGKIEVTMENVGTRLESRDGKPISWFEIAGEEGKFESATAEISGAKIILSSPKVPNPKAVRFAWNQLAEPNLINSAGLPTSAFRAGDVPKPEPPKK